MDSGSRLKEYNCRNRFIFSFLNVLTTIPQQTWGSAPCAMPSLKWSWRIVKCNLCAFKSKSEQDYKTHLQTHEGPKYSCDLCGKQESREIDLEEHMKNEHVKEIFKHYKDSRNRTKHRQDAPVYDRREKMKYSSQERSAKGICSFWRRGICTFGEFCRFSHVEPQASQACYYGNYCERRSTCRFSHSNGSSSNQSRSFLGQKAAYSNQF